MECICDSRRGLHKPFWYAKSPERTTRLCIAWQAEERVRRIEIVLYILFTFHFTLLLLAVGTSFYIPSPRLFRDEIVFSIYCEFRWLAIYIFQTSIIPYEIIRPFRFFPRNVYLVLIVFSLERIKSNFYGGRGLEERHRGQNNLVNSYIYIYIFWYIFIL